MDYRDAIAEIAGRYAEDGEDLEAALLSGAPDVVAAADAKGIADWLENEADEEWGNDPRHPQMAAEIRAAILATKQGR